MSQLYNLVLHCFWYSDISKPAFFKVMLHLTFDKTKLIVEFRPLSKRILLKHKIAELDLIWFWKNHLRLFNTTTALLCHLVLLCQLFISYFPFVYLLKPILLSQFLMISRLPAINACIDAFFVGEDLKVSVKVAKVLAGCHCSRWVAILSNLTSLLNQIINIWKVIVFVFIIII